MSAFPRSIRQCLRTTNAASCLTPATIPRFRTTTTSLRQLHASSSLLAEPFTPKPKQQISLKTGNLSAKRWNGLSGGQKVVRTASTSASAATIVVGLLVTGGIFTFVYLEVMAPDSVTNWFNRAHNRIKADPRCIQLLGDGRIKAYGEPTSNRWARNRPIAGNTIKDPRTGVEHLRIHFNVEGNLDKGVVQVHLIRRPGQDEFEYKYLFIDVPGKQRVYLENADAAGSSGGGSGEKRGFLGVKWGW